MAKEKKDPKVWRKNCGYARLGANGPVEERSQISAPKSLVEKFRATFDETERRAAISFAIEYAVAHKEIALGDEGKKDCEVPKVSNENKVVVFHKRVKEFGEAKVFPKVAVPVADIRTIAESHIDGTTLVRTSDGGTIAVAESFEEAIKIWRAV